jgi:MtN3 and saliva related transmembrane protein
LEVYCTSINKQFILKPLPYLNARGFLFVIIFNINLKNMSKELVEIMGLIGAFLSSITFMPQVYKTWKMKSAGDLSLSMMLIVFTSTIIWLVYGFSLHLMPVIICNGIIMLLSALLIYFKLTFKK